MMSDPLTVGGSGFKAGLPSPHGAADRAPKRDPENTDKQSKEDKPESPKTSRKGDEGIGNSVDVEA